MARQGNEQEDAWKNDTTTLLKIASVFVRLYLACDYRGSHQESKQRLGGREQSSEALQDLQGEKGEQSVRHCMDSSNGQKIQMEKKKETI